MAPEKKVGTEEPTTGAQTKVLDALPGKEHSHSESAAEARMERRPMKRRAAVGKKTRFVLPRREGNKIYIEKEYETEQQAMFDACTLGRPFWVIEQYTAQPQMGGKYLVIKKKPSDDDLPPPAALAPVATR
jgi:hypothetical protein